MVVRVTWASYCYSPASLLLHLSSYTFHRTPLIVHLSSYTSHLTPLTLHLSHGGSQVAFLQEKIHQGEVDRLATERRIREEVATEMKEFL